MVYKKAGLPSPTRYFNENSLMTIDPKLNETLQCCLRSKSKYSRISRCLHSHMAKAEKGQLYRDRFCQGAAFLELDAQWKVTVTAASISRGHAYAWMIQERPALRLTETGNIIKLITCHEATAVKRIVQRDVWTGCQPTLRKDWCSIFTLPSLGWPLFSTRLDNTHIWRTSYAWLYGAVQ